MTIPEKLEKPRPMLVAWGFVRDLVDILTAGSVKHPLLWWEQDNACEVYYNAFMRHVLAAADGELKDPDTGKLHFSHIAANCMILWDLHRRGLLNLPESVNASAESTAPLAETHDCPDPSEMQPFRLRDIARD